WFHRGAMNREHVAVCCVPFIFSLRVVTVIEHLDFDSAEERDPGRGDGCSPDENAGIAAARQVSPFDLKNEVFILAVCAHRAGGTAGAMDDPIADAPGLRRAICIDPTGEIAAVEKG